MSMLKKTLGVLAAAHGFDSSTLKGPPDLQGYAAEHELTYVGEGNVNGMHLGITDSRHWNVTFGKLPGGELGALAHEHVGGEGSGQPDCAQTRVAVRAPEAVAPLRRFQLTNRAFRGHMQRRLGPTDQQVDLASLGLGDGPSAVGTAVGLLGHGDGEGWSMVAANPIDVDVLTSVLRGELGEALEGFPEAFKLEYDHGSLALCRDGGYLAGAELDALTELTCLLAREMRETCLAAAKPLPFDTELPGPAWLDDPAPAGPKVKKVLGMSVMTGLGTVASKETAGFDMPLPEPWRSTVIALAEGGSQIEDPLAYHAAFPSNPVPGHAFAVLRNQLEGGGTSRIALHTEGDLGTGPCAVLFRVNASAQDHPTPLGTAPGSLNVAVKDGLLAAWMHRDASFDVQQINTIATEAVNVANQQGWLPA